MPDSSDKEKSLDIAPPPKKEPRLLETYEGQNEKVGEAQYHLFANAEEYLRFYANRYEYPNYIQDDNNPGDYPNTGARKEMNKKALDMAQDNEDITWKKIDDFEERKKSGVVDSVEEESLKKQENFYGSISEAAFKNTKRGHAYQTFKEAKKSHERMFTDDVEMSDSSETSHADRLTESRKRAFDSYDGPRR